jgi:hypothetical protein
MPLVLARTDAVVDSVVATMKERSPSQWSKSGHIPIILSLIRSPVPHLHLTSCSCRGSISAHAQKVLKYVLASLYDQDFRSAGYFQFMFSEPITSRHLPINVSSSFRSIMYLMCMSIHRVIIIFIGTIQRYI